MFKPYTVAQLIEDLKNVPQDALVLTEGCDCVGPALAISVHKDYSNWLKIGDIGEADPYKKIEFANYIIIERNQDV